MSESGGQQESRKTIYQTEMTRMTMRGVEAGREVGLHYYELIVIFTKALDSHVPLPSAFEKTFGSVVEHNLVAVLDVDGLVGHLLTQRSNMLRLEWGFDEFRKFFYGVLQVSKIKITIKA